VQKRSLVEREYQFLLWKKYLESNHIGLIIETDLIIYSKSEKWPCKLKNTYFNSVIWDSYYFLPCNIVEVQKRYLKAKKISWFFPGCLGH